MTKNAETQKLMKGLSLMIVGCEEGAAKSNLLIRNALGAMNGEHTPRNVTNYLEESAKITEKCESLGMTVMETIKWMMDPEDLKQMRRQIGYGIKLVEELVDITDLPFLKKDLIELKRDSKEAIQELV